MSFRNKILLAIWGVVLGLLIVIYIVINYWMRIQIQSRFTGELRSNYSTIREITDLRAAQDLKSCQVIAETPRLKAVAELKDVNTAFQLCQELNQSIASDLFLLADSNGNLLVELVNGKAASVHIPEFQLMLREPSRRQSSGVWNIGGSVFRTAFSPISIGKDVIGTVTIGFNVTAADVKFVQSMTNSDATLLVDQKLISTSLPDDEAIEVSARLRSIMLSDQANQPGPNVFTIDATGDRYAAIFCQLNTESPPAAPFISFLLVKPMDRELRAALAPVMNTILILSLAVLIITGGIG